MLKKICSCMIVLFLLCIPLMASSEESGEEISSGNESSLNEDTDLIERGWDVTFSGYYKNLYSYQTLENYMGKNPLTTKEKALQSDLQRIRISPEIKYAEVFLLHVDYDNECIWSNYNKSYEFDNYWRASEYNDLVDMTDEPYEGDEILYRTKIHRAYVKLSLRDITLTLGRQQIRFGSGKLWNPLDILNPISPTFVEGAEEQKGTDALRLDYYFNYKTELSFVYDQKRYEDKCNELGVTNSNAITRFKTTVVETDIALLGGWIARRNVGGIDIATIVFDGILRGSIIYSNPEDYENFMQANAGYDYSFRNGVDLLVEYFYNENSLNDNASLQEAYTESLIDGITQNNYFLLSNQFITYNQHYAGLSLGYDFHPLVRGDIFVIYDFQGRGLFYNPALKYNILENTDILLGMMGAYVAEGAGDESDFTAYDEHYMYYTSLKVYF